MTNPSFFPAPRPLLFLDVDGPLIPFGGTREQYVEGLACAEEPARPVDVRLRAGGGWSRSSPRP